jgi:hypothetical protein
MVRVLLFVLPKAQSGCMQANGAMSVIVHSMDGKYSVLSKMYSSIYSCRFCYAQTSFRCSFNWQGAVRCIGRAKACYYSIRRHCHHLCSVC